MKNILFGEYNWQFYYLWIVSILTIYLFSSPALLVSTSIVVVGKRIVEGLYGSGRKEVSRW